ncbi:protein CMSS1 isoform X1 [Clupea harengus]|uniref:Protein CMSS1 isoform X1 n=1 Tax=Clupea harengus TaxID=7950 RepID=A0A6P8GMH2_CLUHA|nr:protein CMSS1 isoform X1 [Clupea harengus]
MGDDLGDEWWVHGGNSGKSDEEVKKKPQGKRKPEEGEEEEEPVKQQRPVKKRKNDEEEEPVKPVKQQTPVKKKKKNDAQKEPVKENKKNTVTQKKSKQVIKQDKDAGHVEGSKKRKRKKKTITDVLASSEVKAGVPEDLQKVLQAHLSSTRSVIEQEELVLQDSSFLTCNDLTHTLSSYMKQVCPKWAKVQKRHTVKQSLVILIACSSALRALELMKQLVAFKGEAKILKLFARHIKVEKQIQLLSNIVAHIGVGTPARITELIQKDGLSLEAVKYLILDWNWRDQKCRRMVDVPEVKVEMFKLLESGILPRCRDGDTKIGLF